MRQLKNNLLQFLCQIELLLIVRNKMGCGAICGDNVLASTSNKKSKVVFQQILQQLRKNDKYSQSQYFKVFHECYIKEPQHFYLQPKDKLIPNQQFPQQILIKWKIVLYGQYNNKSSYANCLGIQEYHSNNHLTQTGNFKVEDPLKFHQSFKQIEKDLDRTFTLPQIRKSSFEKILKKIANYFPKMGYTQGINFIIGYLIIIGYSQQDSFWVFVHIALNKRFLLLGLYQDGFPLVNVLMSIFNNALKRSNEQVYNHVIVELGVDTSQWIFKWFITCYLYSFPRQLIKYIWDLIINVGNLGMICFALALVKQMQATLLQIVQIADISQFFDSLKDINNFNQNVNLRRVIQYAYAFHFTHSDFQGAQDTAGFYGIIVKQAFFLKEQKNVTVVKRQTVEQLNIQKTQIILNQWYDSILRERLTFLNKACEKGIIKQQNQLTVDIKHLKIPQQDDAQQILQAQFNIQLPNRIKKAHSMTQPKDMNVSSKNNGSNSDIQQNRIEYVVDDINQNIEQEDNSIRSSISTSKQPKIKHTKQNVINMDQLDKLQHQFSRNNGTTPSKINNFATISKINKQIRNNKPNNQKKANFSGIKINNYAINPVNSLSIAGQNILKIQKNDNSFDAVSVSSKRATNRSKKPNQKYNRSPLNQPVPAGNRLCSCKQRTEEYKKQVEDHNSEFSESKERFSEKDSNNHNLSHHEKSIHQNYSIHDMQSERTRKIAYEDYMINSHGPQILQKQSSFQNFEKNKKKTENEVQLQLITFKKDKRKTEQTSFAQIAKVAKIEKNVVRGWQNEQQSIQSINHVCYDGMSNRTSRRSQTGNNYEVQSIK